MPLVAPSRGTSGNLRCSGGSHPRGEPQVRNANQAGQDDQVHAGIGLKEGSAGQIHYHPPMLPMLPAQPAGAHANVLFATLHKMGVGAVRQALAGCHSALPAFPCPMPCRVCPLWHAMH